MKQYTSFSQTECENAMDLLTKLDALEGDEWFFRGHADSNYRLIPSLWRNSEDGEGGDEIKRLYENFRKLIHNEQELVTGLPLPVKMGTDLIKEERLIEFILRIRFEHYLLSQFYTISNKAGLKIPNHFTDEQHLYDKDTWLAYSPNGGVQYSNSLRKGCEQQASFWGKYINRALLEQTTLDIDASIPQHYGLPTRLLDWTTNRKKAAYFAAYNPSQQNITGKIAIFAIKKDKCQQLQILNRHLRHENPFLHAQEGVFTDIGGYAENCFLKTGVFPSLEDMHAELPGNTFALEKYTLPVDCIRELLTKLKQDGIYRSTMMPHYTAVVEQVTYDLDINIS